MVTRRTRKYNDKKTIKTFGQLILPLAVIMLFALFFFSVKLFFMDPNDVYLDGGKAQFSSTESIKAKDKADLPSIEEEIVKTEPDLEKKIPEKDVLKTTEINPPVVKPVNKPKSIPAKSKTEVLTKQTTVKKEKTISATEQTKQNEGVSASRWDVQVGGFIAKDSAVALLKEAQNKGYSAYISDSVKDNRPFYKVRVKGFISKDESAKLASKIQSDGYPTYLVLTK